jgi:hypothetical protein
VVIEVGVERIIYNPDMRRAPATGRSGNARLLVPRRTRRRRSRGLDLLGGETRCALAASTFLAFLFTRPSSHVSSIGNGRVAKRKRASFVSFRAFSGASNAAMGDCSRLIAIGELLMCSAGSSAPPWLARSRLQQPRRGPPRHLHGRN